MGLFDFLPCCGKRPADDKDDEPAEADPLLAPVRRGAESITSQEGYGAVGTMAAAAGPEGGLSGAQRARIAEIGREVGNHMLPINQASRAATTSPSGRAPSAARAPSPDSSTASPSRPTTPSPAAGGGIEDSGVLSPGSGDVDGDDVDAGSQEIRSGGTATPPGGEMVVGSEGVVVTKSLFNGAVPGRGSNSKRGGGKKGGRARGRGRSKKQK